jgi:hypothetical protein
VTMMERLSIGKSMALTGAIILNPAVEKVARKARDVARTLPLDPAKGLSPLETLTLK